MFCLSAQHLSLNSTLAFKLLKKVSLRADSDCVHPEHLEEGVENPLYSTNCRMRDAIHLLAGQTELMTQSFTVRPGVSVKWSYQQCHPDIRHGTLWRISPLHETLDNGCAGKLGYSGNEAFGISVPLNKWRKIPKLHSWTLQL